MNYNSPGLSGKPDDKLQNKLISLDEMYRLDVETIREWYKEYVNPGVEDVIYSFSFGEDLVEEAEGAWMYFKKKGKVFDATGGMGVLTLGHNHPRILEARIKFQQARRMEVHKTVFSPYTAALSHNLSSLLNGKLQYSFFCNSGAEAVEGAIKTAYKYHNGKRKHILHSGSAYHGKLLGAGSITGSKEVHFKFPVIGGTHPFVYNSIDTLKQLVDQLRNGGGTSEIYAIIVEPFSVSTLTAAEDDFLKQLRTICDKDDIILIFDEIYSGWYKTGPLFYFLKSEIYPDILAISKALGGGKASISAFVSTSKVFKQAYGNTSDAFLHSTTYNGFGEECVTAIEAINTMLDENVAGRTTLIEKKIIGALENIQLKYPDKIIGWKGAGTLFGMQIKVVPDSLGKLAEILPVGYTRERLFISKLEAAVFCDYLFRHYSIYTFFGGQSEVFVLFSPAAIVSDDDLNAMLAKIDDAVARFSLIDVVDFAIRKFRKMVF
ncbi:MAG: aspartate aminotransferase family protein [Bacteroidota bacterium]|nr:aspartate aminotransferase family protein [Bacteroidota bacterium]